ncbi:hypothetical protein KM176_17950 [Pseudooceanicola sp. CBS1P-1]|uniref:Uncharacterized protein n=1 Tax=Pseudooceanicola albus TaxID=2692189 RepID=A0A6L7G7D5_9RHOB|nr:MULTISPECIES: hypothetical protein [Pseudooceanicola]MBT9385759.1 hypothetical protein [Pseudooceanicola endophyticus]MXN19991.1 hypothetical protein [Pseudooceanicola albus]
MSDRTFFYAPDRRLPPATGFLLAAGFGAIGLISAFLVGLAGAGLGLALLAWLLVPGALLGAVMLGMRVAPRPRCRRCHLREVPRHG